jgi:phosphoglycerate dehydrogenase-like enzyme
LKYTDSKALAEIILVGGKKFDLEDFPKLKGVFKTGVGTDNLPFAEARDKGVAIELPSEKTQDIIFEETAAFTCHLILQGLYVESGTWEAWGKVDRKALHQRRLLVVGAGRIGQRVADKMKSFMVVDTYDSMTDSVDAFKPKVRAADCVSLHVPFTEETRGLFNKERLSWMADGALLVNTARGPVVDEDALFAELFSGRLRAAMDVFWEEPYRGKLTELSDERFIRTPHIASTCKEFIQGTAADFLKFLEKIAVSQGSTK